ncbi:MAG: cupin domain-containing protein [Candidatus Dormibacteraeota bacterium]|nr:cupin domain-containing protein [Candidatus Dormibacteraeota bacterium]
METRTRPRVVGAGTGATGKPGEAARLLGGQTGGVLGVLQWNLPAGVLVPPHWHEHEDEISYTLAGLVVWQLDDQVHRTEAGTTVWRPRGSWHGLWVPREAGPARLLEVIVPGGWDAQINHFVEEILSGRLTATDFVATAASHGVHFDLEAGRALAAKNGVVMLGDSASPAT